MLPHVACLARQQLLGLPLWRTDGTNGSARGTVKCSCESTQFCFFAAWLYDINFNYCYLRCFYLFARSNWDLSEVFSSLPLNAHFRFIFFISDRPERSRTQGRGQQRTLWYVQREVFAVVDGTRTKALCQARPGPSGYRGELGGIHSCFGLRGGVNSCSWSPDYCKCKPIPRDGRGPRWLDLLSQSVKIEGLEVCLCIRLYIGWSFNTFTITYLTAGRDRLN